MFSTENKLSPSFVPPFFLFAFLPLSQPALPLHIPSQVSHVQQGLIQSQPDILENFPSSDEKFNGGYKKIILISDPPRKKYMQLFPGCQRGPSKHFCSKGNRLYIQNFRPKPQIKVNYLRAISCGREIIFLRMHI